MYRKILVLTSTNLACNPRCLKEVRLLVSQGHHVTLVAFNLHNWTTEKEEELRQELKEVEFHYLETGRQAFLPWVLSSVLEKLCGLLSGLFNPGGWITAVAVSKRSWLLLNWGRKNRRSYDLVIAHNPPAFYPTARLAGKQRIPYGLDIEDYHPGEGENKRDQTNQARLMRSLIPRSAYVSYASPLIRESSERLINYRHPSTLEINNVFPGDEFTLPAKDIQGRLKFIWFSQNVDFGRGLEEIIPAFSDYKDQIELTLVGNPKAPFCDKYVMGMDFVRLIPPLSQRELHRSLDDFDAGLAIEPGRDTNNCVALSNKIWAYFQSGLFILASDTPAQVGFLKENPDHGLCIALRKEDIDAAVKRMIENIDAIRATKRRRYESAFAKNWHAESMALLEKWNAILYLS